MEKKIENLRWKPMWVSHLGCIKGCLDYLNIDISDAWLFGATGHAFIINIAKEVVCPSGPTAWRTEMLFNLGKNIGYTIDGIFGFKSKDDFFEKQKKAWEYIKNAIDEDIPCYGWELDIPEFYVIYGYDDDKGYYFSGPLCDSGKGPKMWKEVGDTKIGVLEMYSVKPGQAADDVKTVKEALESALEHSKSPEKWIFPKYKAGLDGFDIWKKTLEAGEADGLGMAFNSAVWSECRNYAVLFLKEAKERLDGKVGPLFDEAISHYGIVAQNLKKVTEAFPLIERKPEHIKDETRISTAVECLTTARSAEASGLEVLEKIIKHL